MALMSFSSGTGVLRPTSASARPPTVGAPAAARRHLPSRSPICTSALSFDAVPIEAVVAGSAVAASVLGLIGWQLTQGGPRAAPAQAPASGAVTAAPPKELLPREGAVMVFGATGRVGRRVVARLLQAGRTVVAAVRTREKAAQVFGEAGLQEGRQQDSVGILFFDTGVDVTRPETLDSPGLWKGVSQVVSLLGPVFGPQPGGGMGYTDGMSPEVVESRGAAALAAAIQKHLPKGAAESVRDVLPMASAEDLEKWERMDDVIMGGQSASSFELFEEGGVRGATWKGDLITVGGGFCGARTVTLPNDLSACDGLAMRVRGDGSTFKFNIKTTEQLASPESTYQATFDTVAGQWSDVRLPWHSFVPVKRAQSDPKGAPLDPARIAKFGLVLSRFEFNGMPNPCFATGTWKLDMDGGLKAYSATRPQIVMISSAGVERNAIIGDDEAARAADIPIVQLNPGGTLNYKYEAEVAMRAAGFPYCVIRSTGMIDSSEGGPFLLEADQGDVISGYMGRDEVADIIVAALSMPEAAHKTFEVRRYEAADASRRLSMSPGAGMARSDYLRLFVRLSPDAHRWRVGLAPFPKPVPPPPPPSDARTQEIVAAVGAVRAQEAAKEAAKEASKVEAKV
ncbi:hypothetical protein FOA52_005472 [Chlamydomonas sp. UWO 241]|nr:hypothetical protein FOA52_005472 [Chlamydomonas sp. UWO 241]